jgi:hypothetical protein
MVSATLSEIVVGVDLSGVLCVTKQQLRRLVDD